MSRTDSAGVWIVTTETSAADAPVYATLDSAPDLTIGALNGPPEEQFSVVTGDDLDVPYVVWYAMRAMET